MNPLIMVVAALLPVAVIILSIEWANQITTGEIIAIGISTLILAGAIIGFVLKRLAPNRAYKMALFDNSVDRILPSSKKEIEEYEVGQNNTVEIHVRLAVKTGAEVDRIHFRLVKRVFPCWRWVVEKTRYAYVYRIWDKNLENERNINPLFQTRGTPLYSQESETGVLHLGKMIRLLKGDIMWYRVIILAFTDWKGYLEFYVPFVDNRRACSRHKVTLRLASDKEDSQN